MATKKTAKRSKQAANPEKTAAKTGRRGGRRGPRGPRAGSKTAFILSQPLDAPAKDVVEAGAKSGHRFDVRYVYAIRSASKAKGGSPAAGDGGPRGARRGPGRRRRDDGDGGALTVAGSLEAQFARMAVDIGIARAEAILRRVREQLERMTF